MGLFTLCERLEQVCDDVGTQMSTINLSGVAETILKDRTRWFLFSPLLIGIGITIYFNFEREPGWEFLLIPVFIATFYSYFFLKGQLLGALPSMILMIVATGFAAGQLRQLSVEAPVFEKKTKITVEATIDQIFIGKKYPNRCRSFNARNANCTDCNFAAAAGPDTSGRI